MNTPVATAPSHDFPAQRVRERRSSDRNSLLSHVIDDLPGMVAFWDAGLSMRYANRAYLEWFGRSVEQMRDVTLPELLGPLYSREEHRVRAVLAGREQIFEEQIVLPDGSPRDIIATYTPAWEGGWVIGFSAHIADVSAVRQRERILAQTISEVIAVLEKTKRSFHSKELGILRGRLDGLLKSWPPRVTTG